MTNKKSTKRALVSSALAVLMCLAMLIGTTFAWFTDTASTAVNKIQSGKLDVALEMWNGEKWENAEGKTLGFLQKQEDGTVVQNADILWEPGCTYELPELRVVNNGNLALKYKVQITGIQGSAKLNEVIDWTINDASIDLTEQHLAAGEKPETGFIIKGHMKEEAGNEYQNLTIDGIGITVYATQDTVESDSYDNQYDEEATYPIEILPGISAAPLAPKTDAAGNVSDYYYENSDKTVTATVPAAAVTEGQTPVITVTPDGKGITATADGKEKLGYDIKIENADVSAETPAEVSFKLGTGLQNVVMIHDGVEMTAAQSAASLPVDSYYYDAVSGMVTLKVSHFSPFSAEFEAPVAAVGSMAYYGLQQAIDGASDKSTIRILRDQTVQGKVIFPEGKTLTVDLNGKTVTAVGNSRGIWADINGNVTFKGDGYVGDKSHEKAGYLFYLTGTLTVEGDATYESGLTVVQLSSANAEMYIKGGSFIGDTYQDKYWTINKLDRYRDTAVAAISGGRFLGFDPSNGHTENPLDNFVIDECGVKKNGDWYEVVAWKNSAAGTKTDPYHITSAVQALQMEDLKGYFVLDKDIVVSDEIYLSGKTYVLDLNGHSITLAYGEGVKPNNGSVLYIGSKNGKLTINDSSADNSGAVIGSDQTYANKVTSAVRIGNYGKLTINGGHFYGMSEGTSCIYTYGKSATVTINGGVFETASPSNGTYYVLNHEDGKSGASYNNKTGGSTMTVNGGKFKNYNPGVTVVDPVNSGTGKISLGTGCSTTEETVGSDTWYTVK